MATYKEIVGQKITKVTSDPSEPKTGQMWYNSTTGTLKGLGILEAWVSASPMINSRNNPAGQGGTQNASWICGGDPPSFTGTEEYNGSGWSSSGNLNNGRQYGNGAGTQTAAITIAGDHPTSPPNNGGTVVEEYDGSSWTAGTAIPEGRYGHATCGAVTTAVIAVAGDQNPPQLSTTKEWNGSSWSEGGAYPTTVFLLNGTGTSTAGLCATGSTPSQINTVAKYDGSSWTTTTNYPSTNQKVGMAGAQTAALCFGGSTSPTNTSFKFDGTTFTATPNMATSGGAFGLNGSSPQNTTLSSFGPGTTEEFTTSTNTITAAAFASGTNLPVTRGQGGGCGTQTAGLQCGGIAASPTANTNTSFEYDGSAWAASPGSLNAATRNNSNFGIQTAAVTVGNLGPVTATVDVYNGSSWTSGTSYPAPVSNIGVAGTTTAGLAWGGDQDPGYLTTTHEYNGSWTGGGAIPAGRSNSACAGTQTAGLSVGGYVGTAAPSASVVASSLEYNGSSWTAGGTDLVARYNAGAAGIQTSALIFGGNTPSNTTQATLYDGTSFSTQPSMGTARFLQTQGLGATSTVALAAAGQTTTRVATVEEFNGETTAANVTDFTTS